MTRAVLTIRASSTLQDALETMSKAGIRHLLVVKDDAEGLNLGSLAGMLSNRDALDPLIRHPEEDVRLELFLVRDVMTRAPLCTVECETTLTHAAALMHGEQISALPVLDGERVVGILTTDDLLYAYSLGTSRT
jgi:acetoin utilization protein AcuB